MSICHYIESYRDPAGLRVSVFQRGNYLYELARGATHLRWLTDMPLDTVRRVLKDEGYRCEGGVA